MKHEVVSAERPVGHGACDWCGTYAPLWEHEMPDGDYVEICWTCHWIKVCQDSVVNDPAVGIDLA